MILTGKEIYDLAVYAGFTIEPQGEVEDDLLEYEYTVSKCPEEGVLDEDTGVTSRTNYVVTCDGCDPHECQPIGGEVSV